MSAGSSDIQQQNTATAFNMQSSVFDNLYIPNLIIQYKRKRVRQHVERFITAGSKILELNAGTGEDAIYFATKGHTVHATDIAAGMQQQLIKKVNEQGLTEKITTELCSFTELDKLQQRGPYDLVFSNFAGLNCTGQLDKVLHSFSDLLKPGGIATLVVMPRFCSWETLLALRGNYKLAFRRFNSKHGVPAHVEGVTFTCWYYSPSYIKKSVQNEFDVLSVEGLCTIVPPSYFENFPRRYKRFYNFLQRMEGLLKSTWPWKNTGDYFIITLRKN